MLLYKVKCKRRLPKAFLFEDSNLLEFLPFNFSLKKRPYTGVVLCHCKGSIPKF